MMRPRLVALVVILVILAAAWTGGWFWLAGWADRKATEAFQELAANGVEINCTDRRVTGFPFAIRIVCGETAVTEHSTETRGNVAGVTGGASVFSPMTARIDMASPAKLDSAKLGAADMQWNAAGLGIGMGVNGPRDLSFDTKEIAASLAVPDLLVQKVAAKGAAGTVGPSPEGGTSVSLGFTDLGLSVAGETLPLVSGSAAGEVSVPPRALLRGRAAIRGPVTARNIDVLLKSGGATFRMEGSISVDGDGVVDGNFALRIAGADKLPAFIAALPADWQKFGNVIAGGLFAFGRATDLDGEPASELKVEIVRGEARIGPIEFGLPRIPI